MVDYSVCLPLIVTSMLAAPLGALTTRWIDTRIFVGIMGVVILLAALRMLFSAPAAVAGSGSSRFTRIFGGGVIGLVIGFLAGLLGIGGGVFVVPLLIYFLKVPTKTAAASSIFIVCFSSVSGFITHASLAAVNWKFVLLPVFFPLPAVRSDHGSWLKSCGGAPSAFCSAFCCCCFVSNCFSGHCFSLIYPQRCNIKITQGECHV
jgi:uncharacterized membrane protein YfcA